ncbi:hypothetical protein SOVF_091520 [Spinacia oleracea]|uniref:Endonuclease/exonuclease/phosphatase domain-containing protein n=1 Tax=Spinacia oleracea TaxID=3562 RepID=A0A9R0IZG1_SPIOL|nr:uncharacterized protein LOC110797643 [Spinacia oleracea]KNA16179.1 hypothetical protein SOVF_091520 [Spinacia oleracea]
MLKLLNKNLRLLYNRLRWSSRRHSNPKIVIKKFGKPAFNPFQVDPELNQYQHHNHHIGNNNDQIKLKPLNPNHAAVYPNTQMPATQKPIRIATFNAALFSMAPAVVPNSDEFSTFQKPPNHNNNNNNNFKAKSLNDRPKGILKQSPLHPISSKTNINNNNPTDSLTKQQKFAKSRLRVSINLPDNEISLGRSRRIGFLDEGKTSTRRLSSEKIDWLSNDSISDRGARFLRSNRAIVDVLRDLDADILALQDVKAEEEREMKPLSDLAAALGMNYVFAESWAPEYGNAVLSKWPIKNWKVQKIFDDTDFRNVLKTRIDVPEVGEVNFYCTHLDHLDENWRMKQINAIIETNHEPHILAGGLNSLEEFDYSQERWTDIVKYYEDIGKPTPKTEVMRYLKDKEYTDAKEFAGECESVVMIAKGQSVQGTCKYGTRLDYILASPALEYKFVPGSYAVLSSKGTSDHHIVKVDLLKINKEQSIQQIAATKKKQQQPNNKKRVVRITANNSSSKGIWSTDMR